MGVIKDSFTFDDVTLVPQYSSVLPSETITVSKLSKNLNLQKTVEEVSHSYLKVVK